FLPPFVPSSTLERLDYRENSVSASVNQLLGNDFIVGGTYKFADVELHDVLPEVPVSALSTADQTLHSELHHAAVYVLFNHPSGFFARGETQWYHQHNSGYSSPMPGDDFFQHNLFAGYRFAHRHVEIL